jgi:glycerate dehydrogenase
MKIVVLDGYALNPGDLSWDGLQELGTVEVFERTPPSLIVQRARDAELILTNKTPLRAETLCQLPRLRYIGLLATGYDCVDLKEAQERRITVTNVPTYGTASVAQWAIALLLALCCHIKEHSEAVCTGQWSQSKDWCFWVSPLVELAGKTICIVGFGRIGRQVAKIADALGMRVMAVDSRRVEAPSYGDFRWATLEEAFTQADVLTLHCPLLPETEGLVNADRLGLMKPTAFLINTSRGRLVVAHDLAEALNSNRLAGAGLDVLWDEPPNPDNPLLEAKNCVITPHIAWATKESRARLMDIAVKNVAEFLDRVEQNVISP